MASSKYFDGLSGARMALWWVVATRIALDEWERLKAIEVLTCGIFDGIPRQEHSVPWLWNGQRQRYYALSGARHVLRAVELLPNPPAVDADLAEDVKAGRDLWEHWDENMPAFSVDGTTDQPPRPSGKGFKARNPDRTPYLAGWSSDRGALLLPRVPASWVHALLDAVEAAVRQDHSALVDALPPRPESPWIQTPTVDGWWPRADLLGREGEPST